MGTSRLPCHPKGIRVWRGYRHIDYLHKRDLFDTRIQKVFVPHTAQQMMPLGLQSYFPTLMPDSPFTSTKQQAEYEGDSLLVLPDEIALVVYPSKDAYTTATKENVAGRAYSMLHLPVFNFSEDVGIPKSETGVPVSYQHRFSPSQLELNTPYSLVDTAIDWQEHTTSVAAFLVPQKLSETELKAQLVQCIDEWLEEEPSSVHGSILCAHRHFVLYWENRSEHAEKNSLVEKLQALFEFCYVNNTATVTRVPPAFTQPDDGVKMNIGETYDVRIRAIT